MTTLERCEGEISRLRYAKILEAPRFALRFLPRSSRPRRARAEVSVLAGAEAESR